jgi:aryl-alcohol dehydrogenase-like predicted oxidoreductase
MTDSRKLGKHGPEIMPVGIGAMSFTNFYGECDADQAFKILKYALDNGVNHVDTANVYGGGVSEERIGKFLANTGKTAKEFFRIATKASVWTDPKTKARSFNNNGTHLEAELTKSLKRLGVECVDLFYVHRRDPNIEIEEVTDSLAKLVKKGMTRFIGYSEIAPSSLRRANAVHHIAAVQSEYSLSTRSPEMGLVQTCAELGTSLVAFSPLGRSLLTDNPITIEKAKSLDFLKNNPRFTSPNYEENIDLTNKLREYSKGRNIPTASLVIAWLLAKSDHIIPIPGTRSINHFKEIIEGTKILLNNELINDVEKILPIGWAHGERYSSPQWIGPEKYC